MSPKKQERLFDKAYSSELMRIAKEDLESAKVLRSSGKGRTENALFLAQQAIEKGLKAVLVKGEIPVPLVHDLGVLLAKLPNDLEPPYGYELNELNQYASIRRYTEGEYSLTSDELNSVMEKAEEMLQWCELNS